MKIKEIEDRFRKGYFGEYIGEIDFLLSRIHELKEAIDKHKSAWINEKTDTSCWSVRDEELYKVKDEE